VQEPVVHRLTQLLPPEVHHRGAALNDLQSRRAHPRDVDHVGAGTYTLAGAPTGYQPVSSIGANNYMPLLRTDGTNWEVGIGQYLAGPDRLTRDAVIASSNAGAAVNWGAGTRTIRCGWPAWLALPRYLSKSVAGGAGTTVLTQNEQRAHVLEFTGALTGNRVIEVDATPWDWIVYNNTSGAFTLTFRSPGRPASSPRYAMTARATSSSSASSAMKRISRRTSRC
jgi:hypothetical protein